MTRITMLVGSAALLTGLAAGVLDAQTQPPFARPFSVGNTVSALPWSPPPTAPSTKSPRT